MTGVALATGGNNCWGTVTATFRADVTARVTGNGTYTIAGLPSSTSAAAADTNGVALVVVYQNATSGIVRRVMIRDGVITTSSSGEVVTDTFAGVAAPIASAGRFHIMVGDGQAGAGQGNLVFNGVLLGTNQFPGSDGSLMDMNTYNVTIPAGQANMTWSHNTLSDCLAFETAVVEFNTAVCGDGVIHSGETCDQGNTTNGDGCSSVCGVEAGWQCSGQPSVCVRVANLGVTKTDGQASAVPGQPLTYTITASNAGPSAITGATVSDALPAALLGATWTCVASAGSSCTPSGSGNINNTVNLLVSGTATFTVTGTVDPAATGSLANTATVAVPAGATDPTPGNNTATDSDTLTPQADLGITKTDGQPTAVPGTPVTYTIVVGNAGPSNTIGAFVADTFPPELMGVTWTCVPSPGGSCAPFGSGNINNSVNVPAGGNVTYTATGTVNPAATGSLVNTATVFVGAGPPDPNLGNNSATDSDALMPEADLVITKTDGQTTAIPGNSVTYTIVVSNGGPSNVTGALVADTVPTSLSGVSWACAPNPGGSCNPAGSGDINDTVNLAAGSLVTYTLTGTLDVAATGILSNTATVTEPGVVVDPDPTNNSATDTDTVVGLDYFTLTPCRVIDTRGGAPIGGPILQGQQTRTFAVVGNCGLPATAKAISINLAVVQPGATGNVRLFPAGQPVPTISSINYGLGQTRSNNAVVPLNALGELAAFVAQPAGTTVHLVIDVNGYFDYE